MHDEPHLSPDEELLEVPAAAARARAVEDAALRHARMASEDAFRLARMRAELADGFAALADVRRAVSVFGSARTPPGEPDYELARAVAARLGRAGVAIITGGGPGIMEAANAGAREAGALSIGLTIDLPDVERVNAYLDVPIHFHYFFARKVMFVRYASAFVVFPGGVGTFDELFELVTLIQTGKIHSRPIVLVNQGYWQPLLDWLRASVLATGRISPSDLDLIVVADGVEEVYELVAPALAAR